MLRLNLKSPFHGLPGNELFGAGRPKTEALAYRPQMLNSQFSQILPENRQIFRSTPVLVGFSAYLG